jgi:hypothetical protein
MTSFSILHPLRHTKRRGLAPAFATPVPELRRAESSVDRRTNLGRFQRFFTVGNRRWHNTLAQYCARRTPAAWHTLREGDMHAQQRMVAQGSSPAAIPSAHNRPSSSQSWAPLAPCEGKISRKASATAFALPSSGFDGATIGSMGFALLVPRQLDDEPRALLWRRVEPDVAAHRFDQPAADGQP